MNKTEFQEKIGYTFKDEELMQTAMTHSSYTRENGMPRTLCYERLEFLGDGFFDAIIGEEMYDRFPNEKEGQLTKYRAKVVCAESLAEIGRKIGVCDMLLLGKGEEHTGGRDRDSIIADATEALIGAVYRDAGYETCRELVLRLFGDIVKEAAVGRRNRDHKSRLQELIQSGGAADIVYELIGEEGPDHAKTFHVRVTVNGEERGCGSGRSKKEAEQMAAREAISRGAQ